MTLHRQLLLFIIAFLLLLLVGTWVAKLNSTRSFLGEQLGSYAQDTATSLGLSLSPHMEDGDIAAAEAMINAVFDGGYYQEIRLTDLAEEVLVHRSLVLRVEEVPSWFIGLFPLSIPAAEANVMAGWRKAGTMYVECHPGYAYQTLWKTMSQTAAWFGAVGLLALAGGALGLSWLFKPLRRVEEQALALCNRDYQLQDRIPRTRELQRMVKAMNLLTTKIKEMFTEQNSIAETLRERAYQDQLTGIGNRRYLEGQVAANLGQQEEIVKGTFLLIQLQSLQALNLRQGYHAGDKLIREAATAMQQSCRSIANAALGRLGGGDFGLYLPNAGAESAQQVAEAILLELRQLAITPGTDTAQLGGVYFHQPANFTQLLTEADQALRQAQHNGSSGGAIRPLSSSTAVPQPGRMQWKGILEHVLEKKELCLFIQPTVNARNIKQVLHLEALPRIADHSGTIHSAGMFVPMAERLGCIHQLDRVIIEMILEQADLFPQGSRLAINLSPLSLDRPDFVDWLLQTLGSKTAPPVRFNFEFAEYRAVSHRTSIRTFAEQVRRMGHYLGIDHFGQGLVNFGYLQSLRPDYVTLDHALTNELRTQAGDSYFLINSLCTVAHSLDIRVMVAGVEQEEQWQVLQTIHIDGVQGFYFSSPHPVGVAG